MDCWSLLKFGHVGSLRVPRGREVVEIQDGGRPQVFNIYVTYTITWPQLVHFAEIWYRV